MGSGEQRQGRTGGRGSSTVLLLLWLDDLGYREIGDVLGLSESNVGVRLNRLKARLRTELAP